MRYFTDKKENIDCFIDYTLEVGCLKTALGNMTYLTPDMLNLAGIHPELTKLLMQQNISTSYNNPSELGEC